MVTSPPSISTHENALLELVFPVIRQLMNTAVGPAVEQRNPDPTWALFPLIVQSSNVMEPLGYER
jgi:hypothetical protein